MKKSAAVLPIRQPTNTSSDSPQALKIPLPEGLSGRIRAVYGAAEDKKRRAQEDADALVRTLLEGFLAAHREADGRNFGLSEDGKALVENIPTQYPTPSS